jgi:hypothetical protein
VATSRAAPALIGSMVKRALKLGEAGASTGDAVASSFSRTWQDHAKQVVRGQRSATSHKAAPPIRGGG